MTLAAVTFDTLKFVGTLEQAQVPREQARAIAAAVRDSHDAAALVTQQDLEIALAPLRAEISEVRKDMHALENRLIIKLSAVMVALIGFAGAVLAVVNRL